MSFFNRKKKDDAAAAAASPNGAPAGAPQPAYGYPGAVAQQQHPQYGAPAPSPYPYSQYPAAVAGYQPPAPSQSAAPQQSFAPPAASSYQPSAMQAYGAPPAQPPTQQQPAMGQQLQHPHQHQQQQSHFGSPPPPVNPQASGYPGMQAMAQQSAYQSQPAAQSQAQPQSQPQPHAHMQQQQPYAYNGYQAAGSNPAQYAPQPQPPQQQPQQPQPQPHYYQNGYPGAPQQPYSAYSASRPPTGGAGVAGYGSAAAPQGAVAPADMKPWENAAQASARLARAEASESRVAATPSAQSAKHKTWAQYQEIEREEREKQQRIQARQQQQLQPHTSTAAGASSPHGQQPLSPDLLSSNAPYHSYPQQQHQQQQQQQQQDVPDLLTWNDQSREQPSTPRASELVTDDAAAKGDWEASDRKEVNGYILRPENEVDEDDEEEEEEEEDDEEEDEASADDDRKAAQQHHDAQQEGAEGQSWQQIGKGKRQPDEFDTDVHGEGQTKEEQVPVASLIDYAEKQQESLNQPLLASPASASDDMSSFGLIAPVPIPATPVAAHFEYAGEGRQAAGSVSSSRPAPGSDSVVVVAPKKASGKKSKKAGNAAAAAPVTAAMSNMSIAAPQQQSAIQPRSPAPAPAAQQFNEPVNPWLATPSGLAVSPYVQRLYAGFAFQLYTDTSSHDLFLFYEPMDGPRGTLYWCQPGKRDKQPQHSMAIHEITHSVLGKHNFPTSNPRAAAAQPIQCFTLYDKNKRLDMCADSGASREEFLKALEEVIRDAPATQIVEASRPQSAAVAASAAVPAVNATAAAAARAQPMPAQVLQSQLPVMQMHQPPQQQPQHAGYYQPAPVPIQPALQSQQAPAGPWYDAYGRPSGVSPAVPSSLPYQPAPYPQVTPQPQQQQQQPYSYAPQYAVPGMSGPVPAAASQPLYAPAGSQPLMQPLLQQQQQQPAAMAGYPAYMQPQQQQPVASASPSQVVQENPDLIKPVHAGVGCDVCKVMPIKDVRYKCALCFNFDLCEKCERKGKHTKSHPLIKMHACGRSRDVSELFHRAQYKELQQQQLTKRPGMPAHSLLTEDVRFNEYHKDMLGRVMAQAHTLPAATMSHLIEILVQLMTATEQNREPFCHIVLRDDNTQRLLLPYPVALDILRLCGFDYVQSKQSGDAMSFQGMEQFDELYFNPKYKLTVVETVVERLLRL